MKLIIMGLMVSVIMLSGCSSSNNNKTEVSPKSGEEIYQSNSNQKADPEAAIKSIYSGLDISLGLVTPTYAEVEEVIGLNLDDIDEFYIRYVDPDFGASDVYIIKPKATDKSKENVLTALRERKDSRIMEFANYDVYDSAAISEDAIIFERGNYAVMLMLADNESARKVIEQYIPEEYDS